MRSIVAVLVALVLCACAGGVKASVRSPIAEAPKFQSPISLDAADKCGPVYKPPVPHIDTGDDPCPGGVCAVPGAPKLPGHDQGVGPKAAATSDGVVKLAAAAAAMCPAGRRRLVPAATCPCRPARP